MLLFGMRYYWQIIFKQMCRVLDINKNLQKFSCVHVLDRFEWLASLYVDVL